ncbi:hypothetical protein NMG60_11006615 [Bertholletia excelsa]
MLFIGNGVPFLGGQRSAMMMEETLKRRSFFTSPEELFDEEYYEEQSPEKKRRLTPEQVQMLEKSFEEENKLEPERKTELAKKLRLQPRQVAVWFQNRRARWKTKQLEREYDLLKSSYGSLLSDCDSMRKENDKLKAQVAALSEKLEAKALPGATISGPETQRLNSGDGAHLLGLQFGGKAEDRLSTGSGVSAVVDEEGPQLVDSGDSYFPDNEYPECVAPVQLEDDDGNDDGRGYFPDVFAAAEEEQEQHEEGESLGLWVWS